MEKAENLRSGEWDGHRSFLIRTGFVAREVTIGERNPARMPQIRQQSDSSATRFRRYKAVLTPLLQRPVFCSGEMHAACPDEKKSFVTRVINELVNDGWVVRETSDEGQDVCRWNTGRGEFSVSRWLDQKIFGTQLKESPQHDRPRERLLSAGVEDLRLAELLAILIRSGRPGESAVAAGEKVAREFQHRLQDLPGAGRGELKAISPAVEKTAWCQIMAGIELGRRIAAQSDRASEARITSSADAIQFCRRRFHRLAVDARQEEFHIVTLGTKNQVIDTHGITVGTLDASLVHPREVFRAAIKDAAASIILVHNHPSGDPTPSREDHAVTRRLESTGELLGITVLDHIVLGSSSAVSIRESRQGG